ncbi:response regulator [Flavobacterium fluviale]|uniref:Response regulator n=1 Tax=Flavobacterium fluviale TaxID=2249356 RepID=A0A344LVY0_9FLAO|nr:response regulator [Flavobacterium fluviale]AXB58072.1 response regulator [Flavobacterium fluviale]
MKIVFLIDDDPDDREIFEESLLSLDVPLKFEEAANGKEAVEKLSSSDFQKPDLIFLDINMPIMDGWQFLKHIKKDENFNDIPVVIYSTSSSQEDKALAVKHQASEFITKPYSISSLRQELKKTIFTFLSAE